ncbi:MAG: motility protein A [Catonella sp.]|nr:motility protein A [Catonella sp.]
MDIATLIGLVGAMGLMAYSIMMDDPAAINGFIHVPSAMITFGGALMCTLAAEKDIKSLVEDLKSIQKVLKPVNFNQAETIKNIINLSNVARKDGLLALEEASAGIVDPFLKKGILLIVDGTDPELVRSILETEISCIEDRHKAKAAFWDNLGLSGPAWGMIGTLIGLINMLKNLSDPSSIGPSMSVALITTFYGSILANWLCTPVASKLKANSAEEIALKTVQVEGILSIQAGENPRVIEEKLKSFLTPADREQFSENAEGGEGGEK